jgi:cysteine-rich repeat protein
MSCTDFGFSNATPGQPSCTFFCDVDPSDCEGTCGDGAIEPDESCDDGNQENNDQCTNVCKNASCGDGFPQPGEECDDGNAVDTDICLPSCKTATCGDGSVLAGTEQCDDGNDVTTDSCAACKTAKCGDGFVFAGTEQCDDGNVMNGDNCDSQCKFTWWSEDFEGGAVLPPEWVLSGNANWFGSQNQPLTGLWDGECGNIGNSQTTSMEVTLNFVANGTVTFWYRTSSESGWDFLKFDLDGVEKAKYSGNTPWSGAVFMVPAGMHTLRWRYTKDSSFDSFTDTVWVDDITTINAVLP